MGVFYGTKPIVSDGLVLHIDPVNIKSMPESGRTDPLTDSSVTDMSGNISSIDIGASKDANDDGQANTWKPEWSSEANGSIRFRSNGVGQYGLDYDYGFLDLGAPVDGVTRFGSTDSYTVEVWWRSTELWASYVYNSGWLLGPEELFSVYPSGFWGREYIWDSFCIGIYKYGDLVNFSWNAGQMKTSSSSGNVTNAQYYNAIGGQTLNDGETWHHECCVFDLGNTLGGGQKIYTYTDGKLARIGTKTTVGSANWIQNTVAGGHRYIGSSSRNEYDGTESVNGIRSNGASGHMGAFKIYDKALTVNQVKQNYDALRERYGTPPPPPPIQSGQVVFVTSGTYSWEVPESIVSICAVCVGGGGGSSSGFSANIKGAGGGGGALSYKNNISVTPGETLTIIVGAAGAGASAGQFSNGGNAGSTSIKRSTTTLLIAYGGAGGTYNGSGGSGGSTWGSADGGGNGGNGGTPTNDWDGVGCGGGGAGGYSGNGGNGGYGVFDPPSDFPSNGSGGSGGAGGGGGPSYSGTQDNGGGGVGIIKTGSNGSGGSSNDWGDGGSGGVNGSSDGTGGNYGGGAGGAGGSSAGSNGAGGAVRIIFGDHFTDTRTYPNTSDNA